MLSSNVEYEINGLLNVGSRGEQEGEQQGEQATWLVQASKAAAPSDAAALLADLRGLIESARQRIATVANASTTILCWNVGRRLLRESLQDGRGAYGRRILATVSQELSAEFGVGFSYTALTRMVRFAEWMTDERIVSTLSTQLSWSHFIELLSIKDPLARDFYAEMCRIERWDVRTLRLKIGGMLLPSLGEQKKIADRLASLDGFIQTEQSKLAKLRQQKQGLMHDLLTGRVRVKMAEMASA
jgi:hypothetical protein